MTTTVMNAMLMGDDDVDDVADFCLCLRLGDFCRSVCRCATRHSAHDVPVDDGCTGSAWCVRPDLSHREYLDGEHAGRACPQCSAHGAGRVTERPRSDRSAWQVLRWQSLALEPGAGKAWRWQPEHWRGAGQASERVFISPERAANLAPRRGALGPADVGTRHPRCRAHWQSLVLCAVRGKTSYELASCLRAR